VSGVEMMTFYMGTKNIGKISSFSYTVADTTFFGNLINNSVALKKFVKYVLPSPAPTTIGSIPDGTYVFSGGTSGLSNINDSIYVAWLDAYKNLDIFDVDIIAVPGNSTQIIIDKIQEVCEYRKDCFGIVDPPETVAGKPNGVITGGVDSMLFWHNGQLPSLDHKLNSKYLATYFPWVLFTTESDITADQWMPPSVVVIEAISNNDKQQSNIFGMPAGKFATLSNINDIAYYITEEEKSNLYDDVLGNNVNPIVYTTRQGFFIDGQKTTQRAIDGINNAYNRINVMRVSLFIKKKLQEIVPNFFYLPIIAATYKEFADVIDNEIMKVLKAKGAIKEGYTIQVDSTINTPEVEAELGMIAIITFTPVKSTEKIKVISIMKDQEVVVQL